MISRVKFLFVELLRDVIYCRNNCFVDLSELGWAGEIRMVSKNGGGSYCFELIYKLIFFLFSVVGKENNVSVAAHFDSLPDRA